MDIDFRLIPVKRKKIRSEKKEDKMNITVAKIKKAILEVLTEKAFRDNPEKWQELTNGINGVDG